MTLWVKMELQVLIKKLYIEMKLFLVGYIYLGEMISLFLNLSNKKKC